MDSETTASIVYGRNSVRHLLEESPQRVSKVYLLKQDHPDKRLQELFSLCKQAGVVAQLVPRAKLDSLALSAEAEEDTSASEKRPRDRDRNFTPGKSIGSVPNHQGVVALTVAVPLLTLEQMLAKLPSPLGKGCLLLLDGVTDPRNLGAILRVADASGVWGVLIGKHRSGTLGPQVAKTASGADLSVPVAQVTNLRQAMETLKDKGFWSVATVCESEKAVPYTRQNWDMPTLLLLGSEGEGLSKQLIKHSDFQVTIPMHGLVNSLNVATAAAILCFEINRQV